MKILEKVTSIWDRIRSIWQTIKPIVCALETEEEEKAILKLLDTYNVSVKMYYKKGNRSYKEVQDPIRDNEYMLIDKVHNRLKKKYESSN